ncbi:hypothetical protein pb186bvf_015688 [Paramecium bursaria]
MSLQNFESLCSSCCNSQNLQVFILILKEKQSAEKQIYSFLEDVRNWNTLLSFIQTYQQSSTIFVISEYLVKIILSERGFKGFENIGDLEQKSEKSKFFEALLPLIMAILIQPQLNYIQNSLCNLVGLLNQQIMMLSNLTFDKYIAQSFQPFFQDANNVQLISVGLKLIQNTIQNVQAYNQYENYVAFRRIMFHFQGADIISFLQLLLQCLGTQGILRQTLQCLKETLTYNFNVSYFELEGDFDSNDQNNVSFPEKFAEAFSDHNFILLLFNLVIQSRENQFTAIKKRVIQDKGKRRMFAKDLFQGSQYIFDNIKSNDEEFVSDILEFNNKLNVNFGLRQVRFDYNFCASWLYSLQTFCVNILQQQIKIKDPQIKQMMELMKKMCKYINDFKIDNHLKINIAKTVGEIGRAIVNKLLNSQQLFFAGYTPQNFKKLKGALKEFFENLFPIIQVDVLHFLKQVQYAFQTIIQQPENEKYIIILSMINHLIVTPSILEKNSQTPEQMQEQTQIIMFILKDVLKYIQNINQIQLKPEIMMTLMNFGENLLSYSLSEIDDGVGKQRNQKQYFNTYIWPLQDVPNGTTQLLSQFFCYTLTIENKDIILYALFILRETIFRLKHHLFSDVFQNLNYVNMIKNVLLNLQNSALTKPQFFSCRTQSAEILSILMLDNAYENYIQSILSLSDLLQLNPTENSIYIYLYEMIGYFRYVDMSKIFRLLIKQHMKKIQDLLQFILVQNPKQLDLGKLCLKLMVSITDNKALRYQYFSSSIVQIELVRSFQYILKQYIVHLIEAITNLNIREQYSDQICRLIGLLFKILLNILRGKYISQACQLLFGDTQYLDLIVSLLELASLMSQYLVFYNKACLCMIQVLQIVSQQQLQIFELAPQTLTKLLYVVDVVQGNLLNTLYEEYRVINQSTANQNQVEKVQLSHTTEIIQNTLEFLQEEQLLSNLLGTQSFLLPMDPIIETILPKLLNCILKGQCSTQTNSQLAVQVFAILCTHQQSFIKVLGQILFNNQQISQDIWQILIEDLDLRIKQQNVEQFRKNFNKLLNRLSMSNIQY